jgi:inosose dehydratase
MNKDNVKLAIAPGWTNDDMPELGSENTFQQIVSEMALAGFTGSEVGSKYPRSGGSQADAGYPRHSDLQRLVQHLFCNGQREKTIDEFVNHMNFLHAMGAKVMAAPSRAAASRGWKTDPGECETVLQRRRVAAGGGRL